MDRFDVPHNIGYRLFAYNNNRIFFPSRSLRSGNSTLGSVYSDIFIFEPSTSADMYSLVVVRNDQLDHFKDYDRIPEETYFSVRVAFLDLVSIVHAHRCR